MLDLRLTELPRDRNLSIRVAPPLSCSPVSNNHHPHTLSRWQVVPSQGLVADFGAAHAPTHSCSPNPHNLSIALPTSPTLPSHLTIIPHPFYLYPCFSRCLPFDYSQRSERRTELPSLESGKPTIQSPCSLFTSTTLADSHLLATRIAAMGVLRPDLIVKST